MKKKIIALLLGSALITTVNAEPIEPEMLEISAGSFMMGHDVWWSYRASTPVREVTMTKYAIAKYEVTNREIKQFFADTGTTFDDTECAGIQSGDSPFGTLDWNTVEDFEPAICVSYQNAQAYVDWLAEETGKPYRLPSEAEWEYAARANVETKFFYGWEWDDACEYDNVYDGGDSQHQCNDGHDGVSIVGIFKPNPWGLFDTIGNITELVADCEHLDYEGAPSTQEAWVDECENDLAPEIVFTMRRGGAYNLPIQGITARNHIGRSESGGFSDIATGFRIAMDLTDGENCLKESDTCTVNDTTKTFRKELFDVQLLNVTPEERALREAQKLADEEAARIAAEEEAARIAAEEEAARIAAEEEAARIAAEEEAASSSSGGALEWFGVLFLSIFLYLRRNKIELTKVW